MAPTPQDPEPRRQPPGDTRRQRDTWELVVREELRRLRRRAPGGGRVADVGSRSAQHREDSDPPPPAP